jgi:hypothetical protein
MMMEESNTRLLFAGLFLPAIFATSAYAQSTNAAPDLTANQTMVDVSALPVGDDLKKALTTEGELLKSGQIQAYVAAASSGNKTWGFSSSNKGSMLSLADLARAALERCQYSYGAPCYIVSINGHDTQLANGGWATQPNMFFKRPGEFDPAVLPFLSADDRAQAAGYRTATGNRAFMITTNGGWVWRSEDTLQKAIESAENACATTYKGDVCLLYAINDRVIFEPF